VFPAGPVAARERVTLPSPFAVVDVVRDAWAPFGPVAVRLVVTVPSAAETELVRVPPLALVTVLLRCADAKLAVAMRKNAVNTTVSDFMIRSSLATRRP
jgi:hypothetical protein